MTTHRHGIETRAEFIPSTADGSYAVGFNYTRGRAFRVTKNLHDKVWLGLEMEEAESTYSAAFVPADVMGLNTSQNTSTGVLLLPFLPNYSNGHSTAMAPDLAAKVAFDPGWGHFEIKGIGRFFRDRIPSTEIAIGHSNVTYGYGVGFAAILPAVIASSFSVLRCPCPNRRCRWACRRPSRPKATRRWERRRRHWNGLCRCP